MSEAVTSLFPKSPRAKIAGAEQPQEQAYVLFRKTFSETFFLMLGAWGVLALWGAFQVYTATRGFTQPFTDIDVLRESALSALAYVGCAFLGLLFGMVQFRSLNVFDQWAFLMHRPVSRTRIFLNMSGAGLAIYGATV